MYCTEFIPSRDGLPIGVDPWLVLERSGHLGLVYLQVHCCRLELKQWSLFIAVKKWIRSPRYWNNEKGSTRKMKRFGCPGDDTIIVM